MKFFETRSWAAPRSLIDQTLGVASTKQITPDRRVAYADPNFQRFYALSGLPPLDELPRGMLLGTVTLDSVERITEEFVEDITLEEQAFGWHELATMPGACVMLAHCNIRSRYQESRGSGTTGGLITQLHSRANLPFRNPPSRKIEDRRDAGSLSG